MSRVVPHVCVFPPSKACSWWCLPGRHCGPFHYYVLFISNTVWKNNSKETEFYLRLSWADLVKYKYNFFSVWISRSKDKFLLIWARFHEGDYTPRLVWWTSCIQVAPAQIHWNVSFLFLGILTREPVCSPYYPKLSVGFIYLSISV